MRLNPWHWWLIGTISVVTGIILVGMSWFYSTADIRRVQAYAKAAGISTTWEEAASSDERRFNTCASMQLAG